MITLFAVLLTASIVLSLNTFAFACFYKEKNYVKVVCILLAATNFLSVMTVWAGFKIQAGTLNTILKGLLEL